MLVFLSTLVLCNPSIDPDDVGLKIELAVKIEVFSESFYFMNLTKFSIECESFGSLSFCFSSC